VEQLNGLQHIRVPPNQTYRSPGVAYVEGDASSASYFLAGSPLPSSFPSSPFLFPLSFLSPFLPHFLDAFPLFMPSSFPSLSVLLPSSHLLSAVADNACDYMDYAESRI
jgi:hypothetical protein